MSVGSEGPIFADRIQSLNRSKKLSNKFGNTSYVALWINHLNAELRTKPPSEGMIILLCEDGRQAGKKGCARFVPELSATINNYRAVPIEKHLEF